MAKKPLEVIEAYFSKVNDPRRDRTKDHKLIDIIAIAICVVICGAEGWTDIELFGNSKLHWLATFLELPKSDKPKPKRESRTRYGLPEAREMGYARGCSRRRLSLVHILARRKAAMWLNSSTHLQKLELSHGRTAFGKIQQ
jgi:hypothetical protein